MKNSPSALGTFLIRLLSLLFVLMCGFFITFLIYFAVLFFQNGFSTELFEKSLSGLSADANQIRILQTIQTVCIFIVPPFLLCSMYGVTSKKFLSLRLPNWKPALAGSLSIVALMPALNVVVDWNAGMHLPEAFQSVELWMRSSEEAAKLITDKLMAGTSVQDLTLNLLVVAVLAGIGEELFFRGLLLRLLLDAFKSKNQHEVKPWVMHVSIWIIAILFSAIHFQFFGFFPRLIIGAWFGYLLWWTGSIWVPVLAHLTNNALATITAFGQNKSLLSNNPDRWGLDETWWLSIASVVLTAVAVFYFVSLKNKEKSR